jgi:hypothetical protein
MHPAYPEIWADLRAASGMNKVASAVDPDDAESGAELLAMKTAHASLTYERIRSMALPRGGTSKVANVNAVLLAVQELRSSHVESGEKLANLRGDGARRIEDHANFEKLAAAVFVDEVLREKTGAEAKLTQLLGEEYAVDLVRELLA